jgi:hypothetical protein
MPVAEPEITPPIFVKVQLLKIPDAGVPKAGVTRVGDVANTKFPEPVDVVIAESKLALEGVANHVAIPVPKPDMPDDTGKPVQFVNVPDVGVPNIGVINVGEVVNDIAPEPLTLAAKAVATPVPNPLIPVEMGRPVQLVNTPALGVPNAGVVKVKFVAAKPDGKVVLRDGTPLPLVIKTELFAAAIVAYAFDPVR